jgi:hypothetical protein
MMPLRNTIGHRHSVATRPQLRMIGVDQSSDEFIDYIVYGLLAGGIEAVGGEEGSKLELEDFLI